MRVQSRSTGNGCSSSSQNSKRCCCMLGYMVPFAIHHAFTTCPFFSQHHAKRTAYVLLPISRSTTDRVSLSSDGGLWVSVRQLEGVVRPAYGSLFSLSHRRRNFHSCISLLAPRKIANSLTLILIAVSTTTVTAVPRWRQPGKLLRHL